MILLQAGDYNYVNTISSKDGITQTSGLLEARFDNIPPVAGEGTVTFKYLANEIIPLNLLQFANDEGMDLLILLRQNPINLNFG